MSANVISHSFSSHRKCYFWFPGSASAAEQFLNILCSAMRKNILHSLILQRHLSRKVSVPATSSHGKQCQPPKKPTNQTAFLRRRQGLLEKNISGDFPDWFCAKIEPAFGNLIRLLPHQGGTVLQTIILPLSLAITLNALSTPTLTLAITCFHPGVKWSFSKGRRWLNTRRIFSSAIVRTQHWRGVLWKKKQQVSLLLTSWCYVTWREVSEIV